MLTWPSCFVFSEDVMAVGVARLGQPTQLILSGTLAQLRDVDFGEPLHSMVICGELHPLEQEMIRYFDVNRAAEGVVKRLPPSPDSSDNESSDDEGEADIDGMLAAAAAPPRAEA